MSDIEKLSSRIIAAMDRVAKGVDALDQRDPAETENLRQALDQEKQVTAELTERVRVLGERQEQAMAGLEARAVEAASRIETLDTEIQQLRAANQMLSEACEALRGANEAGVADPELINRALAVELETLHAARRAERAEADEIMASLMPLLQASARNEATQEVS